MRGTKILVRNEAGINVVDVSRIDWDLYHEAWFAMMQERYGYVREFTCVDCGQRGSVNPRLPLGYWPSICGKCWPAGGPRLRHVRGAMIATVYLFPNSIVMVLDEHGREMPEYQGAADEVIPKIRAAGFRGEIQRRGEMVDGKPGNA